MTRIISDTGPILHLWETGALELLPLLGQVSVPPAVDAEMSRLVHSWDADRPPWLRVMPLSVAEARIAGEWQQAGLLDWGEAEVIALAQAAQPDYILTDDSSARLFARALGLEVHGSLGVVLAAAALGHLTRVKADTALTGLSRSTLWISPSVLNEARAALDDLFA